jgi:hypothetical protein
VAPRMVRIEGVLYSGRVRYASVSGLDRLAEFFLERILPDEPRISVLLDGFGLPPLMIQDILGDLLRGGYASLDLKRGEIRCAPRTEESRRDYRYGDDIVGIWQELVTGRFLPERVIARLKWRPDGAEIVRLGYDRQSLPPDFLEAPNARIIASLNGADRAFLAHPEPGWEVDAIEDRDRLGPLDIYVPIQQTVIASDHEPEFIEYVQADQIPRWLKMAWSRALRKSRPGARVDELGLSAIYPPKDAASPGLLDDCLIETHMERWIGRLSNLIQTENLSCNDVCWDDEAQTRSSLIERAKDAAKIESAFQPSVTTATHIEELWAKTDSYLLVAAPEMPDAIVRRLLELRCCHHGREPYLILVWPGGSSSDIVREARRRDPERRILAPPVGYSIFPAVCIVDGKRTYVATPEGLFSKEPVLHVAGWAPSVEIRSSLEDNEGGALTREVLRERAVGIRPASDDAGHQAINKAINDVNDLGSSIDKIRKSIPEDEIPDSDVSDTDSTEDQKANPRQPSNIVDSHLRKRAEELRPVFGAVALEHPVLVSLQGDDLTDFLRELLERGRLERSQAQIDILINEPNEFWQTSSVLALLNEVICARGTVRITCCARDARPDVETGLVQMALKMKRALGQQATVATSRLFMPPSVILQAGELAIVAVGSPGKATAGAWSFAIRSRRLVDEIHAALAANVVRQTVTS